MGCPYRTTFTRLRHAILRLKGSGTRRWDDEAFFFAAISSDSLPGSRAQVPPSVLQAVVAISTRRQLPSRKQRIQPATLNMECCMDLHGTEGSRPCPEAIGMANSSSPRLFQSTPEIGMRVRVRTLDWSPECSQACQRHNLPEARPPCTVDDRRVLVAEINREWDEYALRSRTHQGGE